MNLNNSEHYLPVLSRSSLTSGSTIMGINYPLFCLNPLEMNTDIQLCYLLQTTTKYILNKWSYFNQPCLVIFKIKHQYISKINSNDPKFSLEKTKKHILCVEYTHPEMTNTIYLDIDPGFFTEYNEIFSSYFVERCLEYQKTDYIFDKNYKLKIMDCMMNMIEIGSDEYMFLEKNEYSIRKNT
jgi:hypothetical protein